MKRLFFSVLIPFFCMQCFAQDGPLTKGEIRLNAGLGVVSYIKLAGGNTSFPPFTVSGEYAVSEDITIGALAGYTATGQDYYSYYGTKTSFKISNTLIGLRANYYFTVDPKYEIYSGVMLGYNAVKISYSSRSDYTEADGFTDGLGGIIYGIHAGARYKFTPLTLAFAELGYGISVLNIGLTIRVPARK